MNYYLVFEVFGNRAQDLGIVQFSGLILDGHTMLEGNVDGALLFSCADSRCCLVKGDFMVDGRSWG
jgi:hypothetical protein